ncbi:hypothetical protein AB0B45_49570 [Nonomuraea sp. NPDC049152]|uniref:hypothetical protein n=1 Tax=Nonomuraea sp. NPDC049152 TaxID=3154350 RepID=UPI0033DAF1D0
MKTADFLRPVPSVSSNSEANDAANMASASHGLHATRRQNPTSLEIAPRVDAPDAQTGGDQSAQEQHGKQVPEAADGERELWDRHLRPVLAAAPAIVVATGAWSTTWGSPPTPPPVDQAALAEQVPPPPPATLPTTSTSTSSPSTSSAPPSATPAPTPRASRTNEHQAVKAGHRRADSYGPRPRPSPRAAKSTAKARAKRSTATPRRAQADHTPKRTSPAVAKLSRWCDRLFPPSRPRTALRNKICHRMYG